MRQVGSSAIALEKCNLYPACVNSPRGIGGGDEKVDYHSVKHVQAMFNAPAEDRERALISTCMVVT